MTESKKPGPSGKPRQVSPVGRDEARDRTADGQEAGPTDPASEEAAHAGRAEAGPAGARALLARRAGGAGDVLPLRDIVVFPHMIVPLFVGREKSVRALEAVMKDDKQILLVAQKNAAQDDPSADDIYRVGTVSTILQLLKLPDGTVKVLVEGGRRARIASFKETESHFEATIEEPLAGPARATPRSWRRSGAPWSDSSSSISS